MIRRLHTTLDGQAMADLGIIAVLLLLPLIIHALGLRLYFVWAPLPVMWP